MITEKSATIWAEARTRLEEALPEIARLIECKFAFLHGKPEPGSGLDQVGLSNGAKIVSGYIAQNELGAALEHLCYMVEEADLPISRRTYTPLKAAEQAMQMDVPALRRVSPYQLTDASEFSPYVRPQDAVLVGGAAVA